MNMAQKQLESVEKALGTLAHNEVWTTPTTSESWTRLSIREESVTDEVLEIFNNDTWTFEADESDGYYYVRNNRLMNDGIELFTKAKSDAVIGTHFIGKVTTTYDELVEILGREHMGESGDGKVHAEWTLEFIDGTIATIYDWKESGIPWHEYDWHIGGHSPVALKWVELLLIKKGK